MSAADGSAAMMQVRLTARVLDSLGFAGLTFESDDNGIDMVKPYDGMRVLQSWVSPFIKLLEPGGFFRVRAGRRSIVLP